MINHLEMFKIVMFSSLCKFKVADQTFEMLICARSSTEFEQ